MILELLDKRDDRLTTMSTDFKFDKEEAMKLFDNLKETMIDHNGMVLTAMQVGIPYRAFVMGNPGDPDSIVGVFNPRVVDESISTTLEEEQCLTFPGLFLKVKRHDWIRVRYTTHEGVTDTIKVGGMTARLFQQAVDQLNGILYTSRANRYHLEQAQKQKVKMDKMRSGKIVV